MRILHCLDSINPALGGPVEYVRQFGKLSGLRNQHIEILSLDDKIDPWRDSFRAPVHCLDYGMSKYQYTRQLVPWVRAHLSRFDAVVSHGIWKYHPVGVWQALREERIPHYVIAHGMLNPWFKITYPLKHVKKLIFWHSLIHPALRDSAAVVFNSEEEKTLATESFSLDGCRQEVVPLGIETPGGDRKRQREAFLARFPELKGKRILLYFGRICEMKGCDLLIRAFARLEPVDSDVHLVVAGPDNGGYLDSVRELAGKLRIAGRIHWTGPLYGEWKWGAMRSADAFILPSHCEAFPVAVLEALACSVPVLISNKVNIYPDVQGDGAGIVFPDTVEGTQRALAQWLALDENARERYRARAQACFSHRYEVSVAMNTFMDLIAGNLRCG